MDPELDQKRCFDCECNFYKDDMYRVDAIWLCEYCYLEFKENHPGHMDGGEIDWLMDTRRGI